jgi:tripartite-type tricarboxylate transporter receptor subunit TctC
MNSGEPDLVIHGQKKVEGKEKTDMNRRDLSHQSGWLTCRRRKEGYAMVRSKKYCIWSCMLLLVGVALVWGSRCDAQEKYPVRPIEIICPTGAGGGNDLQTRVMTGYLSKKWDVPINVINKPGGNSIPGSLVVQNAEPNGYSILNVTSSATSFQAVGIKDLPYNIYDRTFIGITNVFPNVFIVPSNSPFKTLKDAVDDLKKDPGNFTWTSGGGVFTQDVIMRRLLMAINIDINKTRPVLTQAGATQVTLTAGGNVKLGIGSTATTVPAIQGGMVRGVAITGKERFFAIPETPTLAEQGYPTVTGDIWVGFSGPPKMPRQIVERWEAGFQDMLKDPEVLTKLKNIYSAPLYYNSDQMKDFIRKEYEEVSKFWIR